MNLERLNQLFELDADAGVLRRRVASNNRVRVGEVAGSPGAKGYLVAGVDGKKQRVHRVIFLMAYGWLPEQVDHINGNRLDNRPANLRAASGAQNRHNTRIPATNKSGAKGVHLHAQSGKWRARCQVNGKKYSLGIHESVQLASAAATEFREKFHGQFARHQ